MSNTTARTARKTATVINAAAKASTRTRKTVAAAEGNGAARKPRKAITSKAVEAGPKLYTIHSLEEMSIDTRVRRTEALDATEARDLTEMIQRTSVRLWLLVTEAHDRKAHLALGYETWADYAKAELNMSESRTYQYLDTGHVMKALASGGIDIERTAPPPTRVVARVKDRLTDVRRLAEAASRGEPKDLEKALDKSLRSLAREPRKASKRQPVPPVAVAMGTEEPTVKCPACAGTGKVGKPTAAKLKDWLSKIKSS